jgi:hypothetical protein
VSPSPRTVLWRIVAISIGIRIVLQILGMVSLQAHGQGPGASGVDMWSHWDAPHYLRIAEVGYVPDEPVPPECRAVEGKPLSCDDPLFIVFFPFFPAAVAVVAFFVRNLIVSGLVVSLLSSIAATFFLYRLVERDKGHDHAWRTVLLLLSFPTAYYLSAPYSEALFLFAVVAAMYCARTGAWAGAGLAGALATGTRVTGLALGPALLVEAFTGPAPKLERARRIAAIGVASAGIAVYLLINQIVYGDPLHFLDVQRSHWFQHFVFPWQSIVDAVRALIAGPGGSTETFIIWGRICGFVFALPVLVLGLRRVRAGDAVYAWTGFLLILSASWLLSLPRYLLVLYPIFIVGADLIRSRRAMTVAVAAGAAIQAALFWRYAVGGWTF